MDYSSQTSCARSNSNLKFAMSLALSRASRLKPEIRLAQAVSELVAALPLGQKAAFNSIRSQAQAAAPTITDVMQLTAEIDRRALSKVGGQCFGLRFMSFIQSIQQFVALGDIVVGASQQIVACGLWAVVRMALLVSG